MERLMVLAAAAALVVACSIADGQLACSAPVLTECTCESSYNRSRVYSSAQPAVICNGSTTNTLQDVLGALSKTSGQPATIFTLIITKYTMTTEIQEKAFDEYAQLRELVLSDMRVATIHPSAFSQLSRLVSITLTKLRSPQKGLGILDFATLLPNSPTLRIIDLTDSRVSGIARHSFANKAVQTLLVGGTDIASLTEDLLQNIKHISLGSIKWQCTACVCPLVRRALNLSMVWDDRATSVCDSPPAMKGRTLASMNSCGCATLSSSTSLCNEHGDFVCSARTTIPYLDCSNPVGSNTVCVPMVPTTPQATTRAPQPPQATEDGSSWQSKAREFLTSTVGIVTASACAVIVIAMCIVIACCYRQNQRQIRQADSAQRLIHELRASSVRSHNSRDDGQDAFAFPDFGLGPDISGLDSAPDGSIMAAICSGLGGNVGSQKPLPKPGEKSDKSQKTGKPSPGPSPQATPNTSPQRPLSASRPGSMVSRTSLRHQPIYEENEEGDPSDG
ncbi:uncharacterized protein LOC135808568 [Sycon ciliatum]|uniref:uncharacterized protein LOC135808568 n=1 Tax=Sycon ciliatum TaxID=27933 RepID=UPI0031F6B3F4